MVLGGRGDIGGGLLAEEGHSIIVFGYYNPNDFTSRVHRQRECASLSADRRGFSSRMDRSPDNAHFRRNDWPGLAAKIR